MTKPLVPSNAAQINLAVARFKRAEALCIEADKTVESIEESLERAKETQKTTRDALSQARGVVVRLLGAEEDKPTSKGPRLSGDLEKADSILALYVEELGDAEVYRSYQALMAQISGLVARRKMGSDVCH